MARMKIDGVIEAVRYTPDGRITMVRMYERRGAVWSDHILLGRTELVERLRNGLRFVTGQRKKYLGSLFETGSAIRYEHEHILSNGPSAARDLLAGVSIF